LRDSVGVHILHATGLQIHHAFLSNQISWFKELKNEGLPNLTTLEILVRLIENVSLQNSRIKKQSCLTIIIVYILFLNNVILSSYASKLNYKCTKDRTIPAKCTL